MKQTISQNINHNDENFQRKLNELFNPEVDRKNTQNKIEKLQKKILRLNVKSQIKHVFSFLLFSLLFAMCLQYCIRDFGQRVLLIPYYHIYIIAYSSLSILFAFLAIKRIWEFLCLIIETKQNIEQNKANRREGTPIKKKNVLNPIKP
jgi:NhaP-type Na+/H+ or K+/H+ antiporter